MVYSDVVKSSESIEHEIDVPDFLTQEEMPNVCYTRWDKVKTWEISKLSHTMTKIGQ